MKRNILAIVCVSSAMLAAAPVQGAFTFDDIQYWVGTGTNRAAIAIDWSDGSTNPPALVWGYRWNGTAHGRDMLTAVVRADDRLFAKFGGSAGSEDAIYGLGYDANNDGQFAVDDGTTFDAQGVAFTDPADLAQSSDPADYYAEGWFTGFWHYGIASTDPFAGGAWVDSQIGMASRTLSDGTWDSWAIQKSTVPPFTTFANNPQAAVAPLTGDFNGDGHVDSADYDVWKSTFGSTTQLAADANGNGIVDAPDYILWRDHLSASGAASSALITNVPEPASLAILGWLGAQFVFVFAARKVAATPLPCSTSFSFLTLEVPLMKRLSFVVVWAACCVAPSIAQAGIYSGPTDTANPIDPAIPSASPLFTEWANAIDPTRTHFAPRGSTVISNTGFNSLGDLDATQIANGESPGFLTVTFPHPIRNGAGADFAAFENGFTFGSPNGLFAELAYVEVSTNGADFARFPSISTNTAPVTGSGAFAGFDMSNVYNLAGKHAAGFGTPFNLDDLSSNPLVVGGQVNLNNIQFVKLVDIPGNGSFLDSQGHPILDNWLTTGSGGYDFRLPVGLGIGVVNAVPEPPTFFVALSALCSMFVFYRKVRVS